MSRLRVLALALIAVLLVGAVAAQARSKAHKPPSKAKVAQLLRDNYTQESRTYSSVRESYKVQKLVRAHARIGNHFADGTPANKKTYVFPTKVKGVYVKCYSDGSAVRQTIKGDYVFFRDEFGDWTFRIRGEDRSPQPGSDRIPSCPL